MSNHLLLVLALFAWFSGPVVADSGKFHVNLRASSRNLQESPPKEPFPPPGNEYIPPSATNGYERSPCPIINTLANHGFINRNGKGILTSDLAFALTDLLSVSEDFVTNRGDGNPGTGPLDSARLNGLTHFEVDQTTGEVNEMIDLINLHEHNRLEHDASFVRQDKALGGSMPLADPVLVDQLLEFSQLGALTALDLSSAQRRRIRDSLERNPEFTLETGSGAGGASVQAALLLVLQQRAELDWVRTDTLRDFLLFERFPLCYHPDNNWSPGFINHGANANSAHSRLVGAFRQSIDNEARIGVDAPSQTSLSVDVSTPAPPTSGAPLSGVVNFRFCQNVNVVPDVAVCLDQEEGSVCAHAGQVDKAYCSFNIPEAPNACAYCSSDLDDDTFTAYFDTAALEEVECPDENGNLQSCNCGFDCGLPQCSCAEAKEQSCCDEVVMSNSVALFGTEYDPSTTTVIDLSLRRLTGPIPAEVGSMTALTTLWLYDNRLTGQIPSELGRLTDVSRLALDNNLLKGPIPLELWRMTALEVVNLWRNALSGSIPGQVGLLSNLNHLDMEFNIISGSIPTQLGQLSALENIFLNHNFLTGPIPTEFGQLSTLTFLKLSLNSLTGPIPSELGLLTALTHLDLEYNKLTGPIPLELALLTGLTELFVLGNPLLTGTLPYSLCSRLDVHLRTDLPCDGAATATTKTSGAPPTAEEGTLVDRRGDE